MFKLSSRAKDLTNQRFGLLTAVEPVGVTSDGNSVLWKCRCDCGSYVTYSAHSLNSGRTKTCGSSLCKGRSICSVISEDMTGMVFGRLTVLYKTELKSGNSYKWHCRCSCGNECDVSREQLKKGETVSCGCYHLEKVTKWHSDEERKLANIWHRMQQRCYNPTDSNYPRWGARGVTICDEWLKDKRKFIEWGIANGYKPGLTIGRKNEGEFQEQQNGPYAPWNCRWETWQEQGNNRRNNRRIWFGGVNKTLAEWARVFNMDPHRLWTKTDEEIVDTLLEAAAQNASITVGLVNPIVAVERMTCNDKPSVCS